MTFEELKAEIETGPLSAELAAPWAAGEYQTVCNILNDKRITVLDPISPSKVVIWAAKTDAKRKLEAHKNDLGPVGAIADAALLVVTSGTVPQLDLSDPDVAGMFGALVGSGIFTQAEADLLRSQGERKISRLEQLGWDALTVESGQLQAAKELGNV